LRERRERARRKYHPPAQQKRRESLASKIFRGKYVVTAIAAAGAALGYLYSG